MKRPLDKAGTVARPYLLGGRQARKVALAVAAEYGVDFEVLHGFLLRLKDDNQDPKNQ